MTATAAFLIRGALGLGGGPVPVISASVLRGDAALPDVAVDLLEGAFGGGAVAGAATGARVEQVAALEGSIHLRGEARLLAVADDGELAGGAAEAAEEARRRRVVAVGVGAKADLVVHHAENALHAEAAAVAAGTA